MKQDKTWTRVMWALVRRNPSYVRAYEKSKKATNKSARETYLITSGSRFLLPRLYDPNAPLPNGVKFIDRFFTSIETSSKAILSNKEHKDLKPLTDFAKIRDPYGIDDDNDIILIAIDTRSPYFNIGELQSVVDSVKNRNSKLFKLPRIQILSLPSQLKALELSNMGISKTKIAGVLKKVFPNGNFKFGGGDATAVRNHLKQIEKIIRSAPFVDLGDTSRLDETNFW